MELSKLQELTSTKLSELGFELVSLNLSVNKGEKVLSIVVDRVEPIDMDAIVEISHRLNEFYDEIDPIEDGYTLDISSLGAEKPLKVNELDKYVERYVNVHLINPVDGVNADKSLKRTKYEFDYLIPDYETMIKELADWMKKHKDLYPHYHL